MSNSLFNGNIEAENKAQCVFRKGENSKADEWGCCGGRRLAPLGRPVATKAEGIKALKDARRLIKKPKDKRDEEAIRKAQSFRMGALAVAVALSTPQAIISSNPTAALLNEVAVNQDFRDWLLWTVQDPALAQGTLEQTAHVLAGFFDLLPLIGPLIAAVTTWKNGGTRTEVLTATACATFHAFIAALITKFVVAPLLGPVVAEAVAPALVLSGVTLMDWGVANPGCLNCLDDCCACVRGDYDNCECDGCNCVVS